MTRDVIGIVGGKGRHGGGDVLGTAGALHWRASSKALDVHRGFLLALDVHEARLHVVDGNVPVPANSMASDLVNPITPALLAA